MIRPLTEGSQCHRIYKYMQDHKYITQRDCMLMHPPIMRLASRIADLKNVHGIMVLAGREARFDDNGKEISHWTAYSLPTEEELTGE